MSDAFDPYRKWLGISPKDQPPNHYRLLGIDLFESDADVIANAADRQMAHVRTFQSGRHSALSQRILNELAAARVCLLNAERKAIYDEGLRMGMAAAAPPRNGDESSTDEAVSSGETGDVDGSPSDSGAIQVQTAPRPVKSGLGRRVGGGWALLAIVTLVCIALVSTILAVAVSKRSQADQDQTQPTDQNPEEDPAPPTPPVYSGYGRVDDNDTAVAVNNDTSDDGDTTGDEMHLSGPLALTPLHPEMNGGTTDDPFGDNVDDPATTTTDDGEAATADAAPEPLPDAAVVERALDQARRSLQSLLLPQEDRLTARHLAARLVIDHLNRQASAPPLTRYVLWQIVAETAAQAGDARTVRTVADRMAEIYDIDVHAKRAELLKQVVVVEAARSLVAREALAAAESAIADRRFDIAEEMLQLADERVDRSLDSTLAPILKQRLEDVKVLRDVYLSDGYAEAFETLEVDPGSAAAAGMAGRFTCFLLNDWKTGLPLLALGPPSPEQSAAALELTETSDATEIAKIADEWLRIADGGASPPLAANNIKRHAAALLTRALPNLPAPAAANAQARIYEAAALANEMPLPQMPRLTSRIPGNRVLLTSLRGGSTDTELAVAAGLEWILRQQRDDGSFRFTASKATPISTATLVMMPILVAEPGAGARDAAYASCLNRSMAYVAQAAASPSRQAPGFYDDSNWQIPANAVAAITFCEAAAISRDVKTRKLAEGAVNLVAQTQNPDGGWGEHPRWKQLPASPSEMKYLAWNVMALYSARRAGVTVPSKTLTGAKKCLQTLEIREEGRLRYKSMADRTTSDEMSTAAGYLCQVLLEDASDAAEMRRYASELADRGPRPEDTILFNFVATWFLSTQDQDVFEKWDRPMREQLLATQNKRGIYAGCWRNDPPTTEASIYGDCFTTTLAILTLQVYYRYPPID